MNDHNTFLIVWHSGGLESCIDITKLLDSAKQKDKDNIFELIKDPESNPTNDAMREINRYITTASLRARFNSQREYEVYLIETDTCIDELTMIKYFDDNPQSMVNLIRERGKKIVGYNNKQTKVII